MTLNYTQQKELASLYNTGFSKLEPASQIRPAKPFCQ